MSMTFFRRGIPIGVAIAFVGCVRHVQIPRAPLQSAPLAERHSYYRQYHLRMMDHRPIPFVGGPGIALGNGQSIYAQEDILPAISPFSLSAVSVRNSQNQRTYAWILWSVGLGFYAYGGTQFAMDLARGSTGATGDYFTRTLLPLAISIGFVELAAIFFQNAGHERHRALIYYNDSLRERLGLCGDGTQLEDCASAQPPANAGRILPDARLPIAPSVAPRDPPARTPTAATTVGDADRPSSPPSPSPTNSTPPAQPPK